MFSSLLSGAPVFCNEGWNSTNISDNYNQTDQFDVSYTSLRWVAYSFIAPIIISGGLIGNFLNLIVLTRPDLKGVTYVYLTALAVADFGVMICVIPTMIRLNDNYSQSLVSAVFHAHFELVFTNSFMASSIFVVCCMTVDRYISVCFPTKFRRVHTKRNAKVAIIGSYLLAILVSVPLTGLKIVCKISHPHTYSFQENNTITRSYSWMLYLWCSESIVRFGPTIMLSLLNLLIIHKFRKLTAKRRQFRAASQKFRSRHLLDFTTSSGKQPNFLRRNFNEEKRLVFLLTWIIVTFIMTMTPSAFLSLMYTDSLEEHFGFQVFRAVANNLELLNFAFNFYLYFFCSEEFRKVFHLVVASKTCGSVEK